MTELFSSDYALPIAAAAGVLLLAAIVLVACTRRVPPDQALVVVGRRSARAGAAPRVVVGGRVLVWPLSHRGYRMSLRQQRVSLVVEGVDENMIAVRAEVSADFTVCPDDESVQHAVQRFLHRPEAMTTVVEEALESALRSGLGSQPLRRSVADRKGLSDAAVASTRQELAEQGLRVDLLSVGEISTPGSDYLSDLGRVEVARARKEAKVGESESERTAELASIAAATEVAERRKELSLRESANRAETERAEAEAAGVARIARAEQDRLVAAKERAALAEQALAAEDRLEIEVRKPAEAEAYAAVQRANAERDAADATCEAALRTGEAERKRRADLAEGLRLEAAARQEALAGRAALVAEHGTSLLVLDLIDQLPQIVRAAAEPVAATLGRTEGEDSDLMTRGVAGALTASLQAVREVTGVDLAEHMSTIAPTTAPVGAAPAIPTQRAGAPARPVASEDKAAV